MTWVSSQRGDRVTVALVAILKNSRHEKFAQGVASGLSGSEAYRQVAGAAVRKNSDVMADEFDESAQASVSASMN